MSKYMKRQIKISLVVILISGSIAAGLLYHIINEHRELWADYGIIVKIQPIIDSDFFGYHETLDFSILTSQHGTIDYSQPGTIYDPNFWKLNATMFLIQHADGLEVRPA